MKSELSETLTKKQTHTQQNLHRQYGTHTRSAFSKWGCGNELWQNLFRHGARGGRGGTSYWSPLSFSAIDPAWPWASQDGSILQQRGARRQVQGMSWGRTKRKGGREKKKTRKKTEQEQGTETGYDWMRRRVRKSKRENNSEQPRHADMCQACVDMCRHPKAFRSNTRCFIWAQAYWHTIHCQTWANSQSSTKKKRNGKDIWGLMS